MSNPVACFKDSLVVQFESYPVPDACCGDRQPIADFWLVLELFRCPDRGGIEYAVWVIDTLNKDLGRLMDCTIGYDER